jgi:hypothetical protein
MNYALVTSVMLLTTNSMQDPRHAESTDDNSVQMALETLDVLANDNSSNALRRFHDTYSQIFLDVQQRRNAKMRYLTIHGSDIGSFGFQ